MALHSKSTKSWVENDPLSFFESSDPLQPKAPNPSVLQESHVRMRIPLKWYSTHEDIVLELVIERALQLSLKSPELCSSHGLHIALETEEQEPYLTLSHYPEPEFGLETNEFLPKMSLMTTDWIKKLLENEWISPTSRFLYVEGRWQSVMQLNIRN